MAQRREVPDEKTRAERIKRYQAAREWLRKERERPLEPGEREAWFEVKRALDKGRGHPIFFPDKE